MAHHLAGLGVETVAQPAESGTIIAMSVPHHFCPFRRRVKNCVGAQFSRCGTHPVAQISVPLGNNYPEVFTRYERFRRDLRDGAAHLYSAER